MQRERYLDAIKNRISQSEAGSVFVLSDFFDIADTDAVRKAITRIESNKILIRIMRGIYYKPEYSILLGEAIAPAPNAVAHALARNYGWTIVPCGDTALNILGLSTQVPSQWVYVSDGPYKEYSFENTKITFRHTTNKEISKLSTKTALTVQALKALGKENVTDAVITRIRKALSPEETILMFMEARNVTSWIYEYIRMICKGDIK